MAFVEGPGGEGEALSAPYQTLVAPATVCQREATATHTLTEVWTQV